MPRAREMAGVSAFRRSSLAVAGPSGLQCHLTLCLLSQRFPLSQYEIDTSRFAAEGHDRPALSPWHLLYKTHELDEETSPS